MAANSGGKLGKPDSRASPLLQIPIMLWERPWPRTPAINAGNPIRGRARSYKISWHQPVSGCRDIGCRSQLAGESGGRERSDSRASPLLQDQLAPSGIGMPGYWLSEPACWRIRWSGKIRFAGEPAPTRSACTGRYRDAGILVVGASLLANSMVGKDPIRGHTQNTGTRARSCSTVFAMLMSNMYLIYIINIDEPTMLIWISRRATRCAGVTGPDNGSHLSSPWFQGIKKHKEPISDADNQFTVWKYLLANRGFFTG